MCPKDQRVEARELIPLASPNPVELLHGGSTSFRRLEWNVTKNLGLAINLGGLITFHCVTMKLIARIGGIMVSPLDCTPSRKALVFEPRVFYQAENSVTVPV